MGSISGFRRISRMSGAILGRLGRAPTILTTFRRGDIATRSDHSWYGTVKFRAESIKSIVSKNNPAGSTRQVLSQVSQHNGIRNLKTSVGWLKANYAHRELTDES